MTAAGNEHIFSDHLLRPNHHEAVLYTNTELVWPSLLFIVCLFLLAVVKYRAFPRVLRIVQSTFSPQILQQLEREETNALKFYSLALHAFFFFNLTFLLYKINEMHGLVFTDKSSFVQFALFLLIILLLSGGKIILNGFISMVTGERRLVSDYVISSSLVNQTCGLFLFPWIVLLQFSRLNPSLPILGAVIFVGMAVFLKWYRGLMMGLVEQRIGLLQIFSYFCGLEILPLLVMVKYIIETF